MVDRPFFVTADARSALPLDIYQLKKDITHRPFTNYSAQTQDIIKQTLDATPSWLSAAAEAYQISSKLEDFIFVPVISMPSDLPNRNGAAFPYEQLARWNLDAGNIMYKTWCRKPTFVEHANKDATQARGAILECLMQPMRNTISPIWKVIKLSAWDRTKDAILANGILSKQNMHFSMGALCRDYLCSICGASCTANDGLGSCMHVNARNPAKFDKYEGCLAFMNVDDPSGIELSSVGTPAYISASADSYMTL